MRIVLLFQHGVGCGNFPAHRCVVDLIWAKLHHLDEVVFRSIFLSRSPEHNGRTLEEITRFTLTYIGVQWVYSKMGFVHFYRFGTIPAFADLLVYWCRMEDSLKWLLIIVVNRAIQILIWQVVIYAFSLDFVLSKMHATGGLLGHSWAFNIFKDSSMDCQ